jgi:hypothetical protein
LTCIELGLETQRKRVGRAFAPEQNIVIQGSRVSNLEFVWRPHDTLHAIVQNSWPKTLSLDERPNSGKPARSYKITGLHGLRASLIQSLFLHYYETVKSQVEGKYGDDPRRWPSVWDFGRIVRNAFSHGGEIYFTNQKSQAVSWRSLTYGPADNGRAIVYQDVTPVEIILLMDEMDSVV